MKGSCFYEVWLIAPPHLTRLPLTDERPFIGTLLPEERESSAAKKDHTNNSPQIGSLPMPTPSAPRSFNAGFTLMEVLVVLTISAILVAVAVPAFNTSIARARTSEAANTLLAAVELARSEAIRRGVNVTACRVIDPVAPACEAGAAPGGFAAGDWAAGWVVFSETNTAGTVGELDADEPTLMIQQSFATGGARASMIDATANSVITFAPNGTRVGGGALNFEIRYPPNGAAQATRQMTVSVLGQAAITN